MPTRVLVALDGSVLDPQTPVLFADDLAAVRGDGIFETLLVRAGRVMNLERHLTRLELSAHMLDLPAPDLDSWRDAVAVAVDRWSTLSTAEGLLRLFLSRGRESGGPTTALVSVGPVPQRVARVRADGVSVITLDRGFDSDHARRAPWQLLGAKTLSYATNMAALRYAESLGADDVIFVSSDGFVLEGPRSTVALVTDGVLVTPPIEHGVLRGTTVDAVFDAASDMGLRCAHEPVQLSDLVAADTVWLLSSVTLAARVRTLDGVQRVAGRNDEAFARLVDRAVESGK